MKTIHPLACVALSAALFAAVPALAQPPGATTSMDCSEASMQKASDAMMKMKDATKRAAAMKEMDMAKGMMAKKDMQGCMMQMKKAMGMVE